MRNKVSKTIFLKPIGLEHVPAMQQFASDPKVSVPVNFEYPYSGNAAETYIKQHIAEYEVGSSFTFAILRNSIFVGTCNLHSFCQERKVAEMAFWIARPYWRSGYAEQAVQALLKFAFTQMNLHVVTACTFYDNFKAIRFLKKMDFQPKGTILRHSNQLHKSINAYLFELTQKAWLSKMPLSHA